MAGPPLLQRVDSRAGRRLVLGLRLVLVLVCPARAQAPPPTGHDLLKVMHDAYSGDRWFKSLTFTQRTTTRTPAGRDTVSTWYESLRYTDARGTQLRIDIGDPANGNGVLYSSDSLWVFRGGRQVTARPGGNALLPLVEGVYVQPVPRTVAELRPTGVDLSRAVREGRWNARPVWIAGAASDSDVASPQFWVDVETKAVVRAIYSPVPGAPIMDMRLEELRPVGGGWLATRCEFYVGGTRSQLEEYENWNTDRELSPALFEPATWGSAPHWARGTDSRPNTPKP